MNTLNLLGSTSQVETPFIKVVIDGYVFGVYESKRVDAATRVNYPNYVQSLTIPKINGQVNTYELVLKYTIRAGEDPNFFEKIFSKVRKGRKIIFTYGDLSMPSYVYRDEQAIITSVKKSYDLTSASKIFRITATSSAKLLTTSGELFEATYNKPSEIIKQLLRTNRGGITDIFYGMRDIDSPEVQKLIFSEDKEVFIELKRNISVLDYLSYLVSIMVPINQSNNSLRKSSLFGLKLVDDVTGVYNGPYFEIVEISKDKNVDTLYEINVGFPDANAVLSIDVEDSNEYALLYDYNKELNSGFEYIQRIDNEGNIEQVYSPVIGSNNSHYVMEETDRTWWTKMTQYPIRVTLTLKGLLKPALLMSYVKLNVYFYGNKDVLSGLYVVTQQKDSITTSTGFKTTIALLKVKEDDDI